ncbi:MAG TPA: PEP-CTERM sorting domain-containing protein [Armatimonadota bacterium]|jgi:hypothetical protein
MLRLVALYLLTLAFALFQSADAQTISLDGQYIGHASSSGGSTRVHWGFVGTSSELVTAFTNATASEEAEAFAYAFGYMAPLYGSLDLDDGEGNGLLGFLSVGGWLGQPWEGTFQISKGRGRYEGFAGGGTVTVAALPEPNPNRLTAFTIKGTAAPSVPEPSSLLLVGTSALAGLYSVVRRRRS